MTKTIIRTQVDEWEEEICENCGHPAQDHYDTPVEVRDSSGNLMYVAIGCMVLAGTRKIENNPYPRCECMKLV
jgi:uncharacterized cysteine cluster protein YcgN (CxxCxxCC family)